MSFVGVFLFIFVVSCKISVNFGELVVAVSLLMVSDVEIVLSVVMDAMREDAVVMLSKLDCIIFQDRCWELKVMKMYKNRVVN